jgi:hypothetical protein
MTKTTFDIVIVEQGGKLKQTTIALSGKDDVDSESNKQLLYKACGYKLTKSRKTGLDSFGLLHTFDRESFPMDRRDNCSLALNDKDQEVIMVFGKSEGKAGLENKYEFPPPIDNEIYYGNLCLVKCLRGIDNKPLSLRVSEWEKHYEGLFGGFDDCDGSDDEEEPDVLDVISEKRKTKDGYLKDGFIVDDNESESDEEDDYAETELSEEEEFEFSDED